MTRKELQSPQGSLLTARLLSPPKWVENKETGFRRRGDLQRICQSLQSHRKNHRRERPSGLTRNGSISICHEIQWSNRSPPMKMRRIWLYRMSTSIGMQPK